MKAYEFLTEGFDFECGDCPIFAIALHRLTGLPLMGLTEYDEELGSEVLIHAYVRLNNEFVIDSTGDTTVERILNIYPNNGDAYESIFTEKELLDIGYDNNYPPIEQIIPYAEEVLKEIEL
jgi:hypothetical protein